MGTDGTGVYFDRYHSGLKNTLYSSTKCQSEKLHITVEFAKSGHGFRGQMVCSGSLEESLLLFLNEI